MNDADRLGAPDCICPDGFKEDDSFVCVEDTGCKVEAGRK